MEALTTKKLKPTSSSCLSFAEILNHLEGLEQDLKVFKEENICFLPFTRRLKVQLELRESRDDPFHAVPCFTLCGDWLKNLGFNEGSHVRIIGLKELLIIFPEALPLNSSKDL